MSNSTTTIDLISASQSQKEVTANALFDAFSPASNFGRRASTTTGLTWGYYGGVVDISNVPTEIANGTVALSDNATNYVKRTAAGVVSKVTSAPSGWPAVLSGVIALYTVVTSGGLVTSYTDHRLSSGSRGPAGPADDPWVTLTDGATVNTDASLGHNFYLLIGGNRTLANPTNMSDGQCFQWLVKQDGTGTRTLAYGSKFKFCNSSNTLSTAANSVDLIGGVYHSSLDLIFCTLAKAFA